MVFYASVGRMSVLWLATVAAVAFAAPAESAVPWSAPATVARGGAIDLSMEFTGSGRGIATWLDGTNLRTTVIGERGGFGREYTLASREFRASRSPVLLGQDQLLLFGRPIGFGGRPATAMARLGRRRGRAKRISPRRRHAGVHAADATAAGHAAVALIGRRTVWVALRRPGRRFRLRVVASASSASVDVALNERGEALVAWHDASHILARRIDRRGRLGKVQKIAALGPRGFNGIQEPFVSVALGPTGVGLVAWSQTTGPYDGFCTLSSTAAAVAPPRRRFRRPRQLEGNLCDPRPIQVMPAGRRRMLLAWVGRGVRAAMASRARVGRRQTLSAPDSGGTDLGRIATGPGGDAVVPWGVDGGGVLAAVLRPRRATFMAPEEIVPPTGTDRPAPVAAIQPTTGRPFVAWGGKSLRVSSRAPLR